MKSQKSYHNEDIEACLYVVPTPIGNLEDMTFRAITTLKRVDLIAAEDTRNTRKLCAHFEISKPMISYHEHNMESAGAQIINRVENGESVAIVSDAGMPAISDPGYEVVCAAIEKGIKVIALPGANAAITALVASGVTPQSFYFYGFLNRQKGKKRKELELMEHFETTIIFYESPHRLKETVQIMLEVLGDRKVVLAREISKKFEEYLRGSLSEAVEWASANEARGEFVIVVEKGDSSKKASENWWAEMTVADHVEKYISDKNISPNEAMKLVGKDRGLSKRDVYKEFHDV